MDGWIQIGDGDKIPVEDVRIHVDEYHEEFDHERQEKIKVADKVSFKPGKAEYEWEIKPSTMQDFLNHLDALMRKNRAQARILQRANGDHTCKKCKNLISILQEVNGEIMHCGYNCKKSSMREDDIRETRRCELYAGIDTDQRN